MGARNYLFFIFSPKDVYQKYSVSAGVFQLSYYAVADENSKMKLPFSIIMEQAQSFFDLAALEKDDLYWSLFVQYLKESGWTEEEYDAALLNHINSNWEPEQN